MNTADPTFLILLLIVVVGVLIIKGKNAEARSKKLGAAAAGCGVAGFIPALLGPVYKDPSQVKALGSVLELRNSR